MSVTKPPSKPSDTDISTNEALLHHAEASRLAKSWLSGVFGDESSPASIEDEQDDFDKNVAKKPFLYSDTGGIGYTEPTDAASSAASRASDPATAFLRKQMLGRGANQHTFTRGLPPPRSGHPLRRRRHDDEEDEEEGRSRLGKSKALKHKLSNAKVSSSAENMNGADEIVPPPGPPQASSDHPAASHGHQPKTAAQETRGKKKRGSSYLDEILASRASKKKKKKSGKGDDG
ncbi:uncharacterized protein PV06_00856 [Exophiala oligosperma]|uniref:Uncharacterized protein n=1 Tax=Exophiala oligosperma TaxID=215243 RepID=A0A0D2E0C3_9EURO|nr:uncharacterized protein PV06_00856 [Exophiala oligosperma]KIW48250.1 hypothetical protein PV06_00856 [Exophiala oligosperma]